MRRLKWINIIAKLIVIFFADISVNRNSNVPVDTYTMHVDGIHYQRLIPIKAMKFLYLKTR
jgi:hypothetical protein